LSAVGSGNEIGRVARQKLAFRECVGVDAHDPLESGAHWIRVVERRSEKADTIARIGALRAELRARGWAGLRAHVHARAPTPPQAPTYPNEYTPRPGGSK